MIKNYNVKIRNNNYDRYKIYVKYLNDNSHKNHTKKSTKIINNCDTDTFLSISSQKLQNNRYNYMKNGKGGKKLKVMNKSLTFNIPAAFEVNEDIMNDIEFELINKIIELYKSYGVQIQKEEIYNVQHIQSNTHFHTLLPLLNSKGQNYTYINSKGQSIRFMKSKRFLSELKVIWNDLMAVHYQSKEQYQPLTKKQNETNQSIRYLEDLKELLLLDISNEKINDRNKKYFKNQIVKIDRMLGSEEYFENNIKVLNKNVEKMNKTRNSKDRKLPIFRI